ncbi:MAG: TldD/PmbA family protein [bacterium]
MFDELGKLLTRADADYADIRYEVKRETNISFSGRELHGLSASSADGYVLRVLKGGGFASVAFTRPADAERALAVATGNAGLIGRAAKEPVRLAETEVVKDEVRPELDEDPRELSVEDKLALLRKYNDIALDHPKVATTSMGYSDLVREKHFLSTEGSRVREDLVTVRISGGITTREGGLTQSVRVGMGGSDGMGRLRGREEMVEERKKLAVDLLSGEPVKGGTYRAVLDSRLAGVFTHEAFGHFSEADLIEDSPTMREKMQLGAELGTPVLSIKDDPTVAHQLGHYRYDDEGVRARPTQLMKNGVLVGRLHSRRTAAAFGEPLSGHSIAEDYRYAPIIRMGSIFIEPGADTFESLLERLGDGLYLCNAMGGQTSGENFTFGAQYGFEVKGGRKGKMLRDINISGNLYSTLKSITGIAGDLALGEIGGCGKGQTNLRSCYGAPHVLVENVVIGGR